MPNNRSLFILVVFFGVGNPMLISWHVSTIHVGRAATLSPLSVLSEWKNEKGYRNGRLLNIATYRIDWCHSCVALLRSKMHYLDIFNI